jgi:conjugative transfer signal peptidase TraF
MARAPSGMGGIVTSTHSQPPDLPLLRWGDELRHRAALRQYRKNLAVLAALSCGGLVAGPISHPRPVLIWNASASAPLGLYLLSPPPLRVGDMVAARPPARFATLAAARRYLPAGVPLIKTVTATTGDVVCGMGSAILINGERVALRLPVDGLKRPLPSWSGCRRLDHDELLLMNADNPRSFDGRYFGFSHRTDVIGRVALIWRH